MNQVQLIGNLTKDIELRKTAQNINFVMAEKEEAKKNVD